MGELQLKVGDLRLGIGGLEDWRIGGLEDFGSTIFD
jgi:hypothetical protein